MSKRLHVGEDQKCLILSLIKKYDHILFAPQDKNYSMIRLTAERAAKWKEIFDYCKNQINVPMNDVRHVQKMFR